MELLNNTGMLTGYTLGMDPDGRECLVVVVKGTFAIPRDKTQKAELIEDQCPIVEADSFVGEPGFSSPLFESDYAPVKHKCDVTLVGSAYAPGGRAVDMVRVGFTVGQLSKELHVLGDRHWTAGLSEYVPSQAVPFERRAFSYDIAFGGVDNFQSVAQMLDYLASR